MDRTYGYGPYDVGSTPTASTNGHLLLPSGRCALFVAGRWPFSQTTSSSSQSAGLTNRRCGVQVLGRLRSLGGMQTSVCSRSLAQGLTALAQWTERRVSTPGVEGSNPSGGAYIPARERQAVREGTPMPHMLLAPDKTGPGLLIRSEWVQVLPAAPSVQCRTGEAPGS